MTDGFGSGGAGPDPLDEWISGGLSSFAERQVPPGSLPPQMVFPIADEPDGHRAASWIALSFAAIMVLVIAGVVTYVGARNHRSPTAQAPAFSATPTEVPVAVVPFAITPTPSPLLTPSPSATPKPSPTGSPSPTAQPTPKATATARPTPTKTPRPKSTPVPTRAPVGAAHAGMGDNGGTISITVGQQLVVSLGDGQPGGADWKIRKAVPESVVGSDSQNVDSGFGPGCTPADDCGSVTRSFTGLQPGSAAITATRVCGAAKCSGSSDFTLFVLVSG
ncbi:hypothetical protein SAMN05444157_3812 [Frankineae bacterium MT45]|nr:hypothetical protein SAMN05444157_3812 [Frankineae bacterium MT45]